MRLALSLVLSISHCCPALSLMAWCGTVRVLHVAEFLHGDCEGCTAEGRCGCVAIRYTVAIFACFIGNGSELSS